MNKITIVMTTFNLEKYIALAMDELLGQTFEDFNILIIDDCSQDKTVEIIQSYATRFPDKIQLLHLETNLGSPAKVRNYALNSGFISGEYVLFLDGDDSIEPIMLEKMWEIACQNNADMVVCGYDRIDRLSNIVLCKEMQNFPEVLDLTKEKARIPFINSSLWNKLIKTSIIAETRIPDMKVGEDLCFLIYLYRKINKIFFACDILIHYMVRKESIISNTELVTIYKLATELANLHQTSEDLATKDAVALIAFIHIGLSMFIRANSNSEIDINKYLVWMYEYFKINYTSFRKNSLMTIGSLLKYGIKGVAIWHCKILNYFKKMKVFLFLYTVLTNKLRIDFKF